MKKYILLLVVLTGLSVWSSRLGLAGFPFEGKWTATGGNETMGWYQTYEFHGGDYTLKGYPPLSEEGNYKLVSSSKDNTHFVILMEPTDSDSYLTDFQLLEDGTLKMGNYFRMDGFTFSRN